MVTENGTVEFPIDQVTELIKVTIESTWRKMDKIIFLFILKYWSEPNWISGASDVDYRRPTIFQEFSRRLVKTNGRIDNRRAKKTFDPRFEILLEFNSARKNW